MIVKVQMPLAAKDWHAKALVYDEERRFRELMPVSATLRAKMAGRPKAYFEAELVTLDGGGETVEIGDEAPRQEW
jgi:hypothetical protein